MRIAAAAAALDMSPRMLRYREQLGLVPRGRAPVRPPRRRPRSIDRSVDRSVDRGGDRPGDAVRDRGTGRAATHRRYTDDDIATITLAVRLEETYDISPVALAFAVRVLAEPAVGAAVRELGERLGRVPTAAERASEIDRERALRWLGRSGVLPPPRPLPRR